MTSQTSSGSSSAVGLKEFISRCHAALTHQSQGRPDPFLALWSHADDVSIMAAVGGFQVGFEQVRALLIAASKTLHFDTWSAENLVTTVGAELGFSVEVEHYAQQAHQADGTEEQMTLRATQIYRREDGQWKVIHRHAEQLTPFEVKW